MIKREDVHSSLAYVLMCMDTDGKFLKSKQSVYFQIGVSGMKEVSDVL